MFFIHKESRLWQFFVKKDAKKKYILLYTLIVVGPAGLAVGALYVTAQLKLEKLLFSSHLKITNTGEIFRDLMIKTNLIAFMIIIVLVILLSLYVFRRLNTHFHRIEDRFAAMGRGDFSLPPQQLSNLNEISSLIKLSEQTRQDYRQRYAKLDLVLKKLDTRLSTGSPADELNEFAEELATQLRSIHLPESTEQYEV